MQNDEFAVHLVQAIHAIKTHTHQPVQLVTASAWLQEYQWLDDQYPCPVQDYSDETIKEFLTIYLFLHEYCEHAEYNGRCEQAMNEFNRKANDPGTREQWVKKYYNLHSDLFNPPYRSTDVNHVRTIYGTTYVLPVQPVQFVVIFNEAFNKLYYVDLLYPEKIAENKARYNRWLAERTAGIPKTDNPELLCNNCAEFGFCQKSIPKYIANPEVNFYNCKFDR